jgi:hypothetical protein
VTTYPGRIEARCTVPTGGLTVSATNSGGGPTDCTVAAGNYYPTAAGTVSSVLTALKTALDTSRDPAPGTWSVSLSATTGLVSIDCTSGADIEKTGGVNGVWDAGSSSQALTGDVYVQETVGALATGAQRMFGLESGVTGHSFDIEYAIYLGRTGANTLDCYENGSSVFATTFAVDDVLRVQRSGSTVSYIQNGTTIHTSAVSTSAALAADTSFLNTNATFHAIRIYNAGVQVTPVWSSSSVTVTSNTWSLSWTSTVLRDYLGFAANITNSTTAQTGTLQCRGVWIPDCPLQLDGDPEQAPTISDLRTSQSPTGFVLGLSGNTFHRHTGLVYSHVARDRVWESAATYDHASWEWFFRETQLGLESSLFTPASPLQIYWNNAGTLTLLGDAANDGAGTDGWTITGLGSVEPRPSQANYTGLFRIELGTVVSEG